MRHSACATPRISRRRRRSATQQKSPRCVPIEPVALSRPAPAYLEDLCLPLWGCARACMSRIAPPVGAAGAAGPHDNSPLADGAALLLDAPARAGAGAGAASGLRSGFVAAVRSRPTTSAGRSPVSSALSAASVSHFRHWRHASTKPSPQSGSTSFTVATCAATFEAEGCAAPAAAGAAAAGRGSASPAAGMARCGAAMSALRYSYCVASSASRPARMAASTSDSRPWRGSAASRGSRVAPSPTCMRPTHSSRHPCQTSQYASSRAHGAHLQVH